MALLPQQFIDDLKLQANILQVIQEYVPLKRAGTTYKGLCPFHSEKTPSFHVNPEKGFFHCFGCNTGGDVFKFLELHEQVGFHEAVRLLAQRFGLPLPESPELGRDRSRDTAVREDLLKAHEAAAAWFRGQLAGAAGGRAREHLKTRGIEPETVERLGMGYAPSTRDGLKRHLVGLGFPQELLITGGLVSRRENGDLVDRFRSRLIVPICRDSGSVVAFGGRTVDADRAPKYLNSPETPIYSKGRILYGLNLTKNAIRKHGFAVLVEGYFDFAQLFQQDVAPAVASCGTALTQQQAQLLHRFTGKVVLSYDPDAAGVTAAARSSDILVSEGFDVNVAVLDGGADPDVFIRRQGGDSYRERLRRSKPYLEYLMERAAGEADFTQDEGRRTFLAKMLTVAAKMPDAAARDQFADRIAHRARITEEVVRAEIRKAAVGRRTRVTNRELPVVGQLKPAENGLIWGLFHRTDQAVAILAGLDPDDFEQLAGREVFEVARNLQNESPALIPSELLRRLSTITAQLVTRIAGQEAPPVDVEAGLVECARTLQRLRYEREQAAVQMEIDKLQGQGVADDSARIDLLLNQKRNLAQRIEELMQP